MTLDPPLALISNNFETLKDVIASNFTKDVSSRQSWSKIKTKFWRIYNSEIGQKLQ